VVFLAAEASRYGDRADAAGTAEFPRERRGPLGAAGANKFEFDASRKGFARQSAAWEVGLRGFLAREGAALLSLSLGLFASAAPAPGAQKGTADLFYRCGGRAGDAVCYAGGEVVLTTRDGPEIRMR